MRILILVFSGTGNTELTAKSIKSVLISKGVQAEYYNIEDLVYGIKSIDYSSYEKIILGYPIHAFNAPENVVKYIKLLPKSIGQSVYIFKTSGEPFSFNKSSSYLLYNILKKKGYKIMAEKHFLMPYNIIFRYDDRLVKQMYIVMLKMSEEFADKIITDENSQIFFPLGYRFLSFLFRIQWLGAKLNGRLYSADKNKCIMCMTCVNDCPATNISVYKGSIKFNGKCMMCMRCVQNCPSDAINIGILRLWAVRGKYDFDKILADDSISADFISSKTKRYFRLFKKYYKDYIQN